MKDHRVLRVSAGEVATHADLSDVCTGLMTDMVVDSSGRAFVGDFGFDLMGGGAPSPASLKRVDPDGTVTVVAEDLRFPNGSVITPDGGTLIVGETWGNRFTAFDIAPDGSLANRHTWAELGPVPQGDSVQELIGQVVVAPDGCTLDAEGHVWVADGLHSRVLRVAEGETIAEEIATPDGMGVFACALGGGDGRTLLLCCTPDFYEHTRAPVREAVLAGRRPARRPPLTTMDDDAAPPLVEQAVHDDLHGRLRAWRPVELTGVPGWDRGIEPGYPADLVSWAEDYDWRPHEERIRALPWALAGRLRVLTWTTTYWVTGAIGSRSRRTRGRARRRSGSTSRPWSVGSRTTWSAPRARSPSSCSTCASGRSLGSARRVRDRRARGPRLLSGPVAAPPGPWGRPTA